MLGKLVTKYNWFGIFYIAYLFVTLPGILWGISYLFNLGLAGIIGGSILIFLILILSLLLFINFERFINIISKPDPTADIELTES